MRKYGTVDSIGWQCIACTGENVVVVERLMQSQDTNGYVKLNMVIIIRSVLMLNIKKLNKFYQCYLKIQITNFDAICCDTVYRVGYTK